MTEVIYKFGSSIKKRGFCMEGWIKLHRQITENWIWNDKPYSFGQAWIDLLLLANHEDEKLLYHGKIIVCERGTVNRSISSLAIRWGWGRDKARRFLLALESDGMCVMNATTNRTTITIVNYGFFQNVPTTISTTDDAMDDTTSRQRVMQRIDTNKNDKNDKNTLSKEREKKVFRKPDVSEIKAYCQERNNGINPYAFYDFYESKGWKVGNSPMKDWKAAVRTWEAKNGRYKTENRNTGINREDYSVQA